MVLHYAVCLCPTGCDHQTSLEVVSSPPSFSPAPKANREQARQTTKLLGRRSMAHFCWATFQHGTCYGNCAAKSIRSIVHTERIQENIKAEETKKQAHKAKALPDKK